MNNSISKERNRVSKLDIIYVIRLQFVGDRCQPPVSERLILMATRSLYHYLDYTGKYSNNIIQT